MKQPLLYVLIGDSFLCEEKRKELLTLLKKNFGPDLAVSVRRYSEIDLPKLLSEARTLPFLSSAQVFCFPDAHRFTKGDLELWQAYFKSLHSQTFFIFEAESLEKNHPLFETASRLGQVVSLKGGGPKMADEFIRRKLKQAGKKISPEALAILQRSVGEAYGFLDSILDQLVLYTGSRPEINRSDVEAFEEKLRRFEGFDLVEALAGKNLARALEILADLLEVSGQDVPSLVGLIHWQLRRFWEAKKWLAEGLSEREAALRLRLFPPRDAIFFKNLRRFTREDLEKILEGLFDLDWRLKSGRAEGRYEMESWLISAIG